MNEFLTMISPGIGIFISVCVVLFSNIILFTNFRKGFKDKAIRKKIDRIINQRYLSHNKKQKFRKKYVSSIYIDIKKRKQTNSRLFYTYALASIILFIIYFDKFILVYTSMIFIISLLIANIYFRNIINKKNKEFIDDFPDVLDLMARSIISGHSIIDAIQIVAENTSGILSEEFTNISNNISLGSSLQDALEFAKKHIKIPEFHYFAVITYVQQQTGGNIALLLSNLAIGLRKKITMEKKIRAFSSEPIASASIIGSVPFVVIGAIGIFNPGYLSPLFQEQIGRLIILGCVLWQIIGILVIRKIIKIDI